jgi:hypothetical protein
VITPQLSAGALGRAEISMMNRAFPKWFTLLGWIFYVPASLFVIRLLWEKTLLTWREGPQMIGFTMVHLHPIPFFIGVTGMLLCDLWILTAIVFLILRRKTIRPTEKVQFAVVILTIAIDFIPYAFWRALG